MSENERRRKYHYNRVLIETERILSPEFSDAVVFLSGAQVEMLRNVTQYLNRLDTYVTEYNPGYYLAPTADDYDDILEIVADLEEVLMGNPNTLFGFNDVVAYQASNGSADAGSNDVWMNGPSSGNVYRLESMSAVNEDSQCTKIQFKLTGDEGHLILKEVPSPAINERVTWNGIATLDSSVDINITFSRMYSRRQPQSPHTRIFNASDDIIQYAC